MITWLAVKTGIPALLVKLVMSAVGIAVILFALRLYGNVQWQKGEQQGRINGMIEMEKQKQKEWEQREKKLINEREKLAADIRVLETDRQILNARILEVEKQRQREDVLYREVLTWARIAKEKIYADVSNVPAAELISAIRTQSARLPSAIRDGATNNP